MKGVYMHAAIFLQMYSVNIAETKSILVYYNAYNYM